MSSAHKKNLTVGATTAKGAGATVTGDTIVIPPDSEELLLAITADSSIAGVVDATLEVSVDGVNWTTAKTGTGAAGGAPPARLSIDNVDNQTDNNIVTTPALNAAQYTDICRVSFAGSTEALDAEYSLTLSGDDAASYRLNNVTSGDVSAPVTAQFEDNVVLETASTFAFTATGYNHDVTITVAEDEASTTDTVELNCTRTVPATMANGSVAVMDGDAADGVDVCTLTPAGGPTSCTYSLAITGTDAAYYRIHNTTTGAKSDDGAPLKTLAGIALGNSVVLETDELFNFSEAATHSVTITNTESSTGNTAAVSVSITVNAIVTYTNAKYLDFSAGTSTHKIEMGTQINFDDITNGFDISTVSTNAFVKMGLQTDFDDSDSFFFRRRTDKWTLSFWIRFVKSATTDYTNNIYAYDAYVFSCADSLHVGLKAWFRGSDFWLVYSKDSGTSSVWVTGDITDLQNSEWRHMVVTYDGPDALAGNDATAMKLYIDGAAETLTQTEYGGANNWISSDSYDTDNTDKHFRFGAAETPGYSRVNTIFSLKEIGIWKEALTSGNVTTLYNSGTPGYNVALIEASDLKRYYIGATPLSTTDTAGNFTAVLGSAVTQPTEGFWFRRRSDAWTISFWHKATVQSNWVFSSGYSAPGLVLHSTSAANGEWLLYMWGSPYAFWQWEPDDGGPSLTPYDGNWHHICLVYDGPGLLAAGESNGVDYLTWYFDGVDEGITFTSSGSNWLDSDLEATNRASHLTFGAAPSGTNKATAYDDIAIWKTDLSAANVAAIYNSGTPVDVSGIEPASLLRYYKFEESDGEDTSENFTAVIGDGGTFEDH